jgi:hypothetical protein
VGASDGPGWSYRPVLLTIELGYRPGAIIDMEGRGALIPNYHASEK